MLTKALSGISESLALQGYTLKVEQSPRGKIDIIIEAKPQACKECLTSKDVLQRIITKDLDDNGIEYSMVSIKMPF